MLVHQQNTEVIL